MLLRWLPAAALLAVPLEAALLNQIDPLPPQTSPLTFAQSLKEAQDTFAAADKFFAAARLEHARDRESVERMERAVAQHQAEIPGMEFAGMQDPLPLPQIPQRTLPSAFAQSRKVSEAEIPGMEFAGMQDPLPLPQMPQRTLPSAFAQSRKVLEEQQEIPRPELAGMQDPLPLRQTPQRRLPSAFMQSRKVSEEIPRTELAGMQDPLPLRQTPQRRLPSAFTQSRKVSEEIPRTELAGMQDPLPLRQTQQRTSPLAFAQSRKAAEDAWAAADKLFAAARLENTRDSVERVEHAVARARRHQVRVAGQAEIPGAEFAGMQADMHPCKMDCSNQGLCLAGKCMCRDGFYGDLCHLGVDWASTHMGVDSTGLWENHSQQLQNIATACVANAGTQADRADCRAQVSIHDASMIAVGTGNASQADQTETERRFRRGRLFCAWGIGMHRKNARKKRVIIPPRRLDLGKIHWINHDGFNRRPTCLFCTSNFQTEHLFDLRPVVIKCIE
ncbi:unnamed protein product [Durusdinium trenchii]|uniref:EGF-like domain-containing protein n=1 Tax=Durusdinium trenchii TaxID=1381693 RepID=A0ABP0T0N8_9DINO